MFLQRKIDRHWYRMHAMSISTNRQSAELVSDRLSDPTTQRSYGVCVSEYVCCGHTGSFRSNLILHSFFIYLFWLFSIHRTVVHILLDFITHLKLFYSEIIHHNL